MGQSDDLVLPIAPFSKEPIRALFLPISPNLVLAGHDPEEAREVSAEALNLASVEMSRQFFVAGRNTEAERVLTNRLGLRARLVAAGELKQWLPQELR